MRTRARSRACVRERDRFRQGVETERMGAGDGARARRGDRHVCAVALLPQPPFHGQGGAGRRVALGGVVRFVDPGAEGGCAAMSAPQPSTTARNTLTPIAKFGAATTPSVGGGRAHPRLGLVPSSRADHEGRPAGRETVDRARDRRRDREIDRHIRLGPVAAGASAVDCPDDREAMLGRERLDQRPHPPVADEKQPSHLNTEGLCPSDSPTRALAGTPTPLRSRGSLASLVRVIARCSPAKSSRCRWRIAGARCASRQDDRHVPAGRGLRDHPQRKSDQRANDPRRKRRIDRETDRRPR